MDKIYLFKIMVGGKVSYVEIDAPNVRVARLIFRDYKRHYLQGKDFCLLAVCWLFIGSYKDGEK